MSVRMVLAILAALTLTGWSLTASARADGVTDVAMYSDTGDYIGQGVQQLFTPANATIAASGNPSEITISVDSPTGYALEFAAPQGQTLQTGVYEGATRAAFRSGLEPGIDISGEGRGCNTDSGRFEIKDIAFGPDGVPARLWLVYEQHCEGAVPALFGEVRINEPPDAGAGTFSPGLARWPVNGPDVAETVIPVQFIASAPTTLGSPALSGEDPTDFTIRADECRGRTLLPGGVCDIYIRFVPTAPGTRTATLNLSDSAGVTHTTALQGWTYGGTTRLVMTSDPGDWIGQGQQYNFTPPAHTFAANGDRNGFVFNVDAGAWTGSFHPGSGDIFTAGTTYTGAQRDAFRGAAPGIEVDGPGRGCNTIGGDFQVVAATFAPDGTMQTFAIKFDQYCDGNSAGLHGEFDWREGDTTPRAPWMGPGGPCSPQSCATGASSGAGGTGGQGSSSPSATATSSPSAATAPGGATGSGVGLASGYSQPRQSALTASLRASDRRFRRAIGRLRHDLGNTAARRAALAALGAETRDISALHRLIADSRRTANAKPTRRQVLRALSTLRRIVGAERHALTKGAAGAGAAVRVADRDAAGERHALGVVTAAG